MAINRDTLITQAEETLSNLVVERLALSANPKPYYIVSETKQRMSAVEYRRYLDEAIKSIQEQLQLLYGPFEIREYKRPV